MTTTPLEATLERIRTITARDMKNKTKNELFLSVIEEYGELAREVKVEQKVFCNSHKQPDEGSAGESVDLYITAAAMMFAVAPDCTIEGLELVDVHQTTAIELLNVVPEFLWDMTGYVDSCTCVMYAAYDIYMLNEGKTLESFIEYMNKKLDKWEANQNKELERESSK